MLPLHRRAAASLLVGFDPVPAFMRELGRALGGAAYLHRGPEGDAIGVAWRARAAARFGGAPPRAAFDAVGVPVDAPAASATAEEAAAAATASRVLGALAGAFDIGGALVHSVDIPDLA